MRPRVLECDGCGVRVEPDDYGLPDGWVRVKAQTDRANRGEAEGEFCPVCVGAVDVLRLAMRGRPWDPGKPEKAHTQDPTRKNAAAKGGA